MNEISFNEIKNNFKKYSNLLFLKIIFNFLEWNLFNKIQITEKINIL